MYRRYGNQAANKQNQPTESQFVPKQLSKQQLGQWESIFLMISHFLKSHNRQSSSFAFAKLKRFNQVKKKYSSFLANKLHLLQRRKNREYLKWTFANLQSNRISYYTAKKEEHTKMKQNLKNKAASLIVSISAKLDKSKMKNYFQQLRTRAGLSHKLKNFKTLHLFNILTALRVSKMKESIAKIQLYGKNKLRNMRRLSRLEKLVASKHKYFIQSGFIKLRANLVKSRQTQLKEKQNQTVQTKPPGKTTPQSAQQKVSQRELEAEIRKLENEQRTLNEKKKNLERQLTKVENQSQRTLNEFKKEIQRLENQNSELVFNHDLLEQNNQQLQRQYQNKQKSTRKKISKGEIWENVYNNLIHFLAVYKDKPISKAALLECLQMPLVPCNLNVQELNEENQILTELLNEYRKNFPEPQNSAEQLPDLLPFDVIRKQNRYYYMVLEVLSEWGLPGSKELQQLNSDLTTIQKKLVS